VIFNNLPHPGRNDLRLSEPIADDKARSRWRWRSTGDARAGAGGLEGRPGAGAQVLNALFPSSDRDREATQALFEIVKNQPGY
jgi:type I restriction enzyme R subunit